MNRNELSVFDRFLVPPFFTLDNFDFDFAPRSFARRQMAEQAFPGAALRRERRNGDGKVPGAETRRGGRSRRVRHRRRALSRAGR